MTGPGLNILIIGFFFSEGSTFIIVDSTPSEHAPPSMIKGITPDSSVFTAAAEVGEILPKRLALGAAMGDSNEFIISAKILFFDRLTATVCSPDVTMSGTISFFGRMKVSAPGQNSLIKVQVTSAMLSGISATLFNISCPETCTIKGSKLGLCFASKMEAHASAFNALAANP